MVAMEISNSEIQTFKRCRRKWYLTYYHQLGLDDTYFVPKGPMHIGIIVHEALEAYLSDGTHPTIIVKMIYDYHLGRFDGDRIAQVEITKDRDMAVLMVEGYLDWLSEEGIEEDFEVTAAEQIISVKSGITGVNLVGKLDVQGRVRSTGARRFVDHKTVGDLKSPLETVDISEQFKTYGLLQRLLINQPNEWSSGGQINMLRRVKRTVRATPPFYDRKDVRHNETEYRTMWTRIHAVIAQMLVARGRLDHGANHHEIVYPTPTKDCSWDCVFKNVCPQMDDGSRWEGALEENYVKIDPNARYHDITLRERASLWIAEHPTPQKEAS